MPLSTLPKPLSNGTILHKSNKLESSRDVDDFYGTTDQVILFPQEGMWNNNNNNSNRNNNNKNESNSKKAHLERETDHYSNI